MALHLERKLTAKMQQKAPETTREPSNALR
jgi:hypothetical protein